MLGPVQHGTSSFVPASSSGPVQYGNASYIPAVGLGPVQHGNASYVPASSLGPVQYGTTPESVITRLVRRATNRAYVQVVDEPNDIVLVGRIQSVTKIAASAWTDDNVSTIQIGGGAAQERVTIGKAGALSGTRFAAGPNFTDAGIESSLSLMFEAIGANDLTIRSLGQDFPLNDASNLSLDTDYSPRTSVVGALNQLRVLPRPTVGNFYTNGAGSTLQIGEAVQISANLTVSRATAAADNDSAKFIGVVERVTAIGLQARVLTEGPVSALFPAGMGAGDLSKSPVYLHTAVGLLTLTPPNGVGQVVLEVGWVLDSTGYVTGTGGLMLVMLSRGPKRVLP